MTQLEIGFYMLGGIVFMRRVALGDKPGLGRWLLHRLWGILTIRPWPRTPSELSWQAGSVLPWVSESVRHDIREGHQRADEAIAKHHVDHKPYLHP